MILRKSTWLIVLSMFALAIATLVAAGQNQQKQKCQANFSSGETSTVKGEIADVIFPMATLKSDDEQYTVHVGPKWYWTKNQLELEKGKTEIIGKVTVVDGQTHVYPGIIKQGDNSIALTDAAGKPLWFNSGGKQNGKQHGKQHGKSHCGKGNGCCQGKQCGGCKSNIK